MTDSKYIAGSSGGQYQEEEDRPTDEEILEQQNKIREEQLKNAPLVGPTISLDVYVKEFEIGNEAFCCKIEYLLDFYPDTRQVRRDGNCFYRGFIFSYMEALIKTNNIEERDRMRKHLEVCIDRLYQTGYERLVFEDALNVLEQRLDEIGKGLTVEEWELVMADETISNHIVMFLRLVASSEVQLHRSYYEPFILGVSEILDIDLYCRRLMEVMDEESDEIHLQALTDALLIPTRVYALDAKPPVEMVPSDYIPKAAQKKDVIVHLLYRPGHYDIIYPKSP